MNPVERSAKGPGPRKSDPHLVDFASVVVVERTQVQIPYLLLSRQHPGPMIASKDEDKGSEPESARRRRQTRNLRDADQTFAARAFG